jgi:hypothetical protein
MSIRDKVIDEARRYNTLYLTTDGEEMAHGSPLIGALVDLYLASRPLLEWGELSDSEWVEFEDSYRGVEDALRPDAS